MSEQLCHISKKRYGYCCYCTVHGTVVPYGQINDKICNKSKNSEQLVFSVAGRTDLHCTCLYDTVVVYYH